MQLPDWASQAKEIAAPTIEIHFLLHAELYYGPDSPGSLASGDYLERLTLPDISRKNSRAVGLSELVGQEKALGVYYQRLLRVGDKHRLSRRSMAHYFWLRLSLQTKAGKVLVSFPWYDTYREINGFLEILKSDKNGEIYYDTDQGWELELWGDSERFFLSEGDPDDRKGHSQFSFLRSPLRVESEAIQKRAVQTIALLSHQVGEDLWTKHPDR